MHAMTAQGGNGGTATLIIYLSSRWSRTVSFTIRPFYAPRKSPRYAPNGRIGWLQSRAGRFRQANVIKPLPLSLS